MKKGFWEKFDDFTEDHMMAISFVWPLIVVVVIDVFFALFDK
ncbi:hypothetical protein LEBR102806_11625 [Levilactobacillus brevis]|uniref:Uncharacterized protein n=1 Tax=Levilactobacillus brevis ATCC 14869 = DSM 20054 TaxID=649758 RepID=U2PLH4_LEVBR|nr:hypothetical protein [Levilactobacillus brevis]ERK44614.1 hypothetical protein HMPREF0495_00823 [Levilactobacillus brevis ATCC 14869 = DSM 20054]SQG81346.1 Uncharacterised protein [Levilactobacillus brevis]